jgi:hypothetical protein
MAKKLKIPKRIAGIKIPKTIRKGPVGDFLRSSAGQLVIAEALVAAAGVFTVKKADPALDAADVVKHPGDSVRRAVQALSGSGPDQTQRLTFALKEAARAFKTAMESGPPAGQANEALPVKAEGESSAKKKSLSPRDPGSIPH